MDTILSLRAKYEDLTNIKKSNYHQSAPQLAKHEDVTCMFIPPEDNLQNVGSNHCQEDQRTLAPVERNSYSGELSGPILTVALSRTLMEHGSATLCFRRACSNSCNGGRSHFPKTTRSMSLVRREIHLSHNTLHQEVTSHVGGQLPSMLPLYQKVIAESHQAPKRWALNAALEPCNYAKQA